MTDRPTRVAILGVAHTAHAASYARWLIDSANVEVVGVYDRDPELGTAFADHYGLSYSDSLDKILENGRPDAVVVCSATAEHASLTVAAAEAGAHVLCEKPLATTLKDAERMINACAEAGVQLHTAFVCRFYPVVQAARAKILENELGPVRAIVGGNRGLPPLPPHYPAWITNETAAGGGALIDHSVHVIDAMRFITGSEVTSVSAEIGSLLHELEVEDSALMLLSFDNGMVGSVDPSWSIPAANPFHYDFYLRVLSTDGALELNDTRQALNLASDKDDSQGAHLEPFGVNIDRLMIDHFIQCVRNGEFISPAASGEDGLRALEVALAAYEAARTGSTVQVSNSM